MSQRSFARVLRENGINTKLKNRYIIKNESYFENINTEFKAYILGFIYADGFVGTHNDFCLSLTDKVYDNYIILNKLKDELGIDLEVKHTFDKNNHGHYTLKFSNKKVFEDLQKLHVNTCKSLTMTEIPEIEQSLYRHFIRGYFDGDGTICTYYDTYDRRQRYCMEILGTKEFLKKIQDILSIECEIKKTALHDVKHVNGLTRISYRGIKNLIKIREYFYTNATVYLTYKKERFYNIQPL